MFADPVSNLMLIILLFFAGLLVMFVFILRSLELTAQSQEETRRQLAISLTDLERKVADLTFALGEKGLIELEHPPAPILLAEASQAVEGAPNLPDLADLFENGKKPEPEQE